MKRDGRKRTREVSYYHPETNIHFAEDRMAGFVDEYNRCQSFSAMLPGLLPRPTLLDLCVSAYLQGVYDTVQVATERGMNFATLNEASAGAETPATEQPPPSNRGSDADGSEC